MSSTILTSPVAALAVPPRAPRTDRWVAGLSGFILLTFLVFSIFPEVISPYDPVAQSILHRFEEPSASHLFGTDELGRDLLSRVIYGTRISMGTMLVAVLMSLLLGVPIGLVGGYLGGWVDEALSRATDILLSFPGIILAMALIAVMGRNPIMVAIVIGIVSAPAFIRITRAIALKVKNLAFVDAVRSAGASDLYIMWATVLPNCLSQIYVQALLTASRAVLLESGLAFLGLGLPPPAPSWGAMLDTGRNYLYEMPWYGILPGLFLLALVLALQLSSESLRRAFRI